MTRTMESGGHTLHFRPYRKRGVVEARLLTKEDHVRLNGIIQTLEGPKKFVPGDYLARDRKGNWPIKARKMSADYTRITKPGTGGWARFQVRDVRLAAQVAVSFKVGGLRGKAGNFLVTDSRNVRRLKISGNQPIQISGINCWPVDKNLFTRRTK